MKTLILAAIRCSLLFVLPTLTYGSSAQWDLDPMSGDWNTADNWTPNGVPNGPADTATFGLSNTTDVSISEDTEVNSIIFTPAATNPYSISVNAGSTLTVSGVGILNNSGGDPFDKIFFTGLDGGNGQIRFTNGCTAGNAVISNEGGFFGGSISFFNRSTAGSSTIESDGTVNFFDRSTAGNAAIDNDGGFLSFSDRSSAGSARIELFDGGFLFFGDSSNAGSAILLAEGTLFGEECCGPAFIFFQTLPRAAQRKFTCPGQAITST
jgi:hypothetical protein